MIIWKFKWVSMFPDLGQQTSNVQVNFMRHKYSIGCLNCNYMNLYATKKRYSLWHLFATILGNLCYSALQISWMFMERMQFNWCIWIYVQLFMLWYLTFVFMQWKNNVFSKFNICVCETSTIGDTLVYWIRAHHLGNCKKI